MHKLMLHFVQFMTQLRLPLLLEVSSCHALLQTSLKSLPDALPSESGIGHMTVEPRTAPPFKYAYRGVQKGLLRAKLLVVLPKVMLHPTLPILLSYFVHPEMDGTVLVCTCG